MNSALATRQLDKTATLWSLHREASLNWLALGLLLAAWNAASDSDPKTSSIADSGAGPRPHYLQGYVCVSVRAAQRFVCTSHKSVNTL